MGRRRLFTNDLVHNGLRDVSAAVFRQSSVNGAPAKVAEDKRRRPNHLVVHDLGVFLPNKGLGFGSVEHGFDSIVCVDGSNVCFYGPLDPVTSSWWTLRATGRFRLDKTQKLHV